MRESPGAPVDANAATDADVQALDAAVIRVDWPAPPQVRALVTTRNGGRSSGPYSGAASSGGLNLGTRCGDLPEDVAANRALLRALLPGDPRWLLQVHGSTVVDAAAVRPGKEPAADAAFTTRRGVVCAVQMADCMPILLCDSGASAVAVAHAGWRGLASGVIEATVRALAGAAAVDPAQLLVYLGPAIGLTAFEVGEDVPAAFVAGDPHAASCFQPASGENKWLCNLEALARRRLDRLGITEVYGGGRCTFTEADQFYSYRRDGATGRMAALIWIE